LGALGSKIHKMLFDAGIESPEPEGAFYLFLDFKNYSDKLRTKNIQTGLELTSKILQDTGVALLPGSAFGRPEEEFTARLAYVDFDGNRALAAAEILQPEESISDDFISTYCSSLLEGTNKLTDWLRSL